MEHNDLKHYGYLFKTDKITKHGYHRFYHKELAEYKHKTFGMIEIGVANFNSIDMWKQYFPKSFIYGIDINVQYYDERIKVFRADQSNLASLQDIKSQITHPILFINDDGSHIPEHQLLSFDYLFSNVLKDGGTYIIEDIEVSYWKNGKLYGYVAEYGFGHSSSIVEKFKLLVDYVNSYFLNEENKKLLDEKTSFVSKETKDKILSITFSPNCIIIKKKGINDYHYTRNKYEFINFIQ
jgi:hypothetical protein